MKDELYEFNLNIYPLTVWISISKGKFEDKFDDMYDFGDNSVDAITESVYDKINKKGGLLIRFSNKRKMSASLMAHEAVHAAAFVFDYIGEKVDGKEHEAYAYLVGYIVECCNEVKNNKVKPISYAKRKNKNKSKSI